MADADELAQQVADQVAERVKAEFPSHKVVTEPWDHGARVRLTMVDSKSSHLLRLPHLLVHEFREDASKLDLLIVSIRRNIEAAAAGNGSVSDS